MTPISNCPVCGKAPEKWHAKEAFHSRALYWIGCKQDGRMQGGVSQNAAIQSWNRDAAIVKWVAR